MKGFWVGVLIPILILCGVLIVNQFYPFLNLATNQVVNDPVSTSEYTITVATNAGTVVEYVDYDIITADDYIVESDIDDEQFFQLSIYNTETETQLQNNSAIEIGDELQINVAILDCYVIDLFIVNCVDFVNGDIIVVTGNLYVYIQILPIDNNEPVVAGTDGLVYEINETYGTAICTGLGTATDLDIVIANTYLGAPVTAISADFGAGSGIESITLPRYLSYFGYEGGFQNCLSLENIYVHENSLNYRSINGILYMVNILSDENDVPTIGSASLICFPPAKNLESYELNHNSSTMFGVAVGDFFCFNIESYAFSNNIYLKDIIFDDSGNNYLFDLINKTAFNGCSSLETITIDYSEYPFTFNEDQTEFFTGLTNLIAVYVRSANVAYYKSTHLTELADYIFAIS